MRQFYFVVACMISCSALAADWRQFRGPFGNGVSPEMGLPTKWSDESNLAWKAALPGRGLSSPIVVGNSVVVTACTGYRQDSLHVLCFDSSTGKQRWKRSFLATGRTMTHPKTSTAAPTPTSDGKRIFANFSTNDVVCLDLDGNLIWLRGLTLDYPNASNSLGMASSLVYAAGTLIVQVENDSESIAVGLDPATGLNKWKIDRPSLANWTSPLAMQHQGETVVLLQSGRGMTAYDPSDGSELWNYGDGCSTIPSSAIAGNLLLVPSHGLTALKPPISGSTPEILWRDNKLGPATASPVVYRDRVYTVNNVGVIKCATVEDGKVQWQVRTKGPYSGSPVIADGHMYFFNEDGLGQVIQLGQKGKVVHSHGFGETILCTPAIAGGAIYVRSDQHLWKIAKSN